MKPAFLLFFASCLCVVAAPDDAKGAKEPSKPEAAETKDPVVKTSTVTIDGNTIPYQVTTGKLQLKKKDGGPLASIFHVSYERTGVSDLSKRPVVFAFNGGPGSSAVWLHIGAIGPRRIEMPGDGTIAPAPPAHVVENPYSILDVADLVFIDPVSTGYSRAEKDVKPSDFHGVEEDIQSVGDFIRRWVTEHDRWSSPKYLLGESYGGIRAAGLSRHLQSRFGMSLNGVVMLSTLLDFRTLQNTQGSNLSYQVFLPVFTGAAHHHGKIQGDRDALVAEARDFAFGEYASALMKGVALPDDERDRLSEKLGAFTGIDAQVWRDRNLRISPTLFRTELLRKEGKALGRFDARVAWPSGDPTSQMPEGDPSYSVTYGAFASAMLAYMSAELGWKEDQPYEILTGEVQPWKWNANNRFVNLSDNLSGAMRENPHLRVLVMGGYTDLATPPDGMAYSIRQMIDLPASLRENISYTYYDGGHMFYLNPPDLHKARTDLVNFIQAGQP